MIEGELSFRMFNCKSDVIFDTTELNTEGCGLSCH